MFDIGGTELLVLAIVAIIVVGPKELPRMLRTVGQFVGRAKMMAREFQNHFNEAASEAGLDDVRKEISEATSGSGVGDVLKPFTEAGNEIKRNIEKVDTPKAASAASASAATGGTGTGTGSGTGTSDGAGAAPEPAAAPADKAAETTGADDAKPASS